MMYTIFLFGVTAILSSIFVITARNPVHSVLALVWSYISTCGIMILLDVEFMALLFLIVYVGAIAILFLFVVMMLNIKLEELKDNATRYLPIGILIGIVFIIELLLILESEISFSFPLDSSFSFINPSLGNIQSIGSVLYTDFWIYMIIASLILLIAMLGAIVLTLHHESSTVRRQDIFGQLATTNSLTIKNKI